MGSLQPRQGPLLGILGLWWVLGSDFGGGAMGEGGTWRVLFSGSKGDTR